MPMPSVEIAQQEVLLNIVHHDSGEEPEEACTNTLVVAKVREVSYQYLNMPVNEAIKQLVADIAQDAILDPAVPVPRMLTIVISQFNKSTRIDWHGAVSTLARMELLSRA